MKKEYTDEYLIAYLEGELSENEMKQLDEELESNPALAERIKQFETLDELIGSSTSYSFSEKVRQELNLHIEAERRQTGISQYSLLRIAASVALILTAFAAGYLVSRQPRQNEQISQLQEQVTNLQEMVMMGSLKTHTASERLQVLYRLEEEPITEINDELLKTLIQTLNTDESPNVRYAALQALKHYKHEERVVLALISSLEQQNDAFIQIALIQTLVDAEARAAISPLKKVLKNQDAPEEVKKQAQVAIDILI